MDIKFDFSELTRLAADLGKVADNAGPLIRSAVEVTSGRVKKAAQESVKKGSRSWKALPAAIDYDITVGAGRGGSRITSEIGYNLDKAAGPLGHIRESGSPRATPHNDLLKALKENEGDFQRGLEIALADAEGAVGL